MTLRSSRLGRVLTLAIDRAEIGNAIDPALLAGLDDALAAAEADPEVRVVVLEGRPGVFSTGMALGDLEREDVARPEVAARARAYYRTLVRIACCRRLVVAAVDGVVEAGGVGLVAACDHVLSTPRSTFRLTEAILGLLPASVLPFLVRRIGWARAYRMTLTAEAIPAGRAEAIGLVDGIVDDLEDGKRRFALKAGRLHESTVERMKAYFRELAPPVEDLEDRAVDLVTEMLGEPETLERIRDVLRHGLWGRDR